MSNLTDLKTAKGSIRVSKFKKRYIENIMEQAKKCSNIQEIILFGSSLEERCTEESDVDILSESIMSDSLKKNNSFCIFL